MASKKAAEHDAPLPLPALRLLAPPLRLVSAAAWKALEQRDVAQYGAVEEFVTSVCESVPGVLTARHQGKLALGLRGRLILELLSCGPDPPDREEITRHLERFRAPAPRPAARHGKKDLKIERTVRSFQELVETLLQHPAERLLFFKEEFPEEYGPKFDQELEKLLWEFLIRLDQLLPVPNLAQTVSWLGAAPPVLEECARAATQPQLLRTILQYQSCLGHLEAADSLPPKMGDSILTSLSLPPSGKASSERTPAADRAPFIAPVIALISNEDVPAMISARRKEKEKEKEKEKAVAKGSNGAKRKKPADSAEEGTEEEQEEEEEERLARRGVPKRRRRSLKKRSRRESVPQRGGGQSLSEDGERDEAPGAAGPAPPAVVPLRPDLTSCLPRQAKVLLYRLDAALFANANVEGARSGHDRRGDAQGSAVDVHAKNDALENSGGRRRKRATGTPCSETKENRPLLAGISSYPTMTERHPSPADGQDVIGDSEDEATANSKGALFVQRYYKTKLHTYVPTLREFWKPWMTEPNALSPR